MVLGSPVHGMTRHSPDFFEAPLEEWVSAFEGREG